MNPKKRAIGLAVFAAVVLAAAAQVTRDEFDALRKEVEGLTNRVVLLEVELKALKQQMGQPAAAQRQAQAPAVPAGAAYTWIGYDGRPKGTVTFLANRTFRVDNGELVVHADFWCRSPKEKVDRDYKWRVTPEGLELTFMVGKWLFPGPLTSATLQGHYIGKSDAGKGKQAALVALNPAGHQHFTAVVNARGEQAALADQAVAEHKTNESPATFVNGRWEFGSRHVAQDDMGPFRAQCMRFTNDEHGNLICSAKISYGGLNSRTYERAHFEVWAYDGPDCTGNSWHDGGDILNFAPSSTRVLTDRKLSEVDARAIRSCRIRFSTAQSR